ncbi:mechanosensitive ion channel family protein [Pontibacter akesuensis]|uniref:Small-conductance mechanosensitive channel n=1 Tax=Pontibacter akesuensis TaxID=388950 RepID=A0A1I7FT13_9BACT|nr:mechanosensitive ion channel family protein [Pontibacter akesuensis]GHA60650.1 hypothetical protein GCM10007389_11160 [Pontibacter akesuensis]SFU39325.1 Small-conductance mechanosensitive channel [Pontibacter akesuensis]
MNEILDNVYYYNTVQAYLIVLGFVLLGFVLIGFFKNSILTRIARLTQRTNTRIDNFLVESIYRFGIPALYISVVYLGLDYLKLPGRVNNIILVATTVAVTILVIRMVSSTILLMLRAYIHGQENGDEKVKQLGGIMLIVNIIIWGIGLLTLLDNLGYDVTTVVAGLGIGGIAVALAAQNILGDLFNYFVIFFDRPFEVGDFITIDDKSGVVDKIGIKTSRVKSLTGEQLIFSNSDLTNSRIHNYKRMEQRRISFKIGIIYQTPLEQLEEIPGLLRSIVEAQEQARFDRAHFASYGDSSLNFEVVYYVLASDYAVYMDTQQSINLAIFKAFKQNGIEFAYPTQTLFMVQNGQEKQEEAESVPKRSFNN